MSFFVFIFLACLNKLAFALAGQLNGHTGPSSEGRKRKAPGHWDERIPVYLLPQSFSFLLSPFSPCSDHPLLPSYRYTSRKHGQPE
jgi:hypothetical protein